MPIQIRCKEENVHLIKAGNSRSNGGNNSSHVQDKQCSDLIYLTAAWQNARECFLLSTNSLSRTWCEKQQRAATKRSDEKHFHRQIVHFILVIDSIVCPRNRAEQVFNTQMDEWMCISNVLRCELAFSLSSHTWLAFPHRPLQVRII